MYMKVNLKNVPQILRGDFCFQMFCYVQFYMQQYNKMNMLSK
jgi:hypothetical protein